MGITPSDFDIFESYVELGRRKFIAASLLTFGHRLLNTATIVKKLDEISTFYEESKNHLVEFPNKFPDVLFDSLIDTIRISICFENYFKAKLLLNEFVIHNIDKNKNAELFKKQKAEPIAVNEISVDKTLFGVSILKSVLNETTINYSIILDNPSYYRHLSVEPATLNLLTDLNKKRNRLHLLTSEKLSLSKNILSQYKELKRIADLDIAILQNTLLDELDPDSKSKIQLYY
jgi:hypothetical protein